MQLPPARIGAPIDEIDTPALIVELDAFERNLKRLADFARAQGVRLRPHAKTHKCPTVALKQIALGAVGQCCQKVGEAEVLVRSGIKDVLVSNQVVALPKLRRLAALAKDATVALCFDAPGPIEAASRIAQEFGVELGALVEVDVGAGRCGVPPGQPARELARLIAGSPGLKFRGLQAYQGASQHLALYAERQQAIANATKAVKDTLAALNEDGIACELVTGAGTGTYMFEGTSGVWNELQCGSYAFMDTDYARIGSKTSDRYTDFDHSLFVLASVMSVPRPEHAIVDAGLKAMSAEKGPPWVHGLDDVECIGVSDEHGKLKLGPKARKLAHGDKVWLIPGHCDPTINLHDWYVGVRNGRVEQLWPIAARGASS
jgi:D-serine deaminase-like pyridoxal phosphate-dependent protein